MDEVYVPRVGFRSADGLGLRGRAVVEQGDRALAVLDLVSSPGGTLVAFEVRDDELQSSCLGGSFDHRALMGVEATLRDGAGRSYARAAFPNGLGLGQGDFGFFRRQIGFDPLAPDVREVRLDLHGALGDWSVPVPVAPLRELGLARKRPLDAAAARAGITLRVTGLARCEDETIVAFDVPEIPRGVEFRAVGDMFQRQREHVLVLRDGEGASYPEVLSRETVQHPQDDPRTGGYAKFPPIPAQVRQLTLVAGTMVVEEPAATLEVALPLTEARDLAFGTHRLNIHSAILTHDLLSPPGEPPAYGLRMAVGPAERGDGRVAVRPARVVVGGLTRHCGAGWHPDPAVTNIDVVLPDDARPTTVTLSGAVVRVAGPWEVAFTAPR